MEKGPFWPFPNLASLICMYECIYISDVYVSGIEQRGMNQSCVTYQKSKLLPGYLILSRRKCRDIQCLIGFGPIFSKEWSKFSKTATSVPKIVYNQFRSPPLIRSLVYMYQGSSMGMTDPNGGEDQNRKKTHFRRKNQTKRGRRKYNYDTFSAQNG